jgi:hypothetical protein
VVNALRQLGLVASKPGKNRAAPWRPADEGYRTCDNCLDLIRGSLTEIAERYQRLDPSPGASGDGSRGAPKFRVPVARVVIAITDPRSGAVARTWRGADGRLYREAERPPLLVFGVLDTQAWEVVEARAGEGGARPAATSPGCAGGWITSWTGSFARRWLSSSTSRCAGWSHNCARSPAIHVGQSGCPNTVDDGGHTRECGIYAPCWGTRSFVARADGNGVRMNGCVLATCWELGGCPHVPEGARRLGGCG